MISLQSEDQRRNCFGEQPLCPQLHLEASWLILPPGPQPVGLGECPSFGYDMIYLAMIWSKACLGRGCAIKSWWDLLWGIWKRTRVTAFRTVGIRKVIQKGRKWKSWVSQSHKKEGRREERSWGGRSGWRAIGHSRRTDGPLTMSVASWLRARLASWADVVLVSQLWCW